MSWILRGALIALLTLAGLYVADYVSARYRIPGNRQTLGSVQVQTLYAVRQKDGRFEYSLGDLEAQTCVRSLFPHLGYTPCWYLSSHATKRIEIARVLPWRPATRSGIVDTQVSGAAARNPSHRIASARRHRPGASG